MNVRQSGLAAGLFAMALLVGACGSGDSDTTTSSASSPTTAASATTTTMSSTPAVTTPQNPKPEASNVAPVPAPHHTTPKAQPEQDDDPGGHPCTDQSGAPGYLIPGSSGGWVCNITGDAPQATTQSHATHDDDPGGHPCTDQSGAPGYLIPGSSGGWVCNITGDAPR
ncbi:MAG: hypothetical protein WBA98_07625 [Gordonia sp. (in: high G+C Gram-positive bacteria)]|uniref:hypothetical protein n=1 Tax=Gordonia sp. (in: high G+C Gram-positive bacteria) TaxID=84139 RepID=UPI003C757E27